MAWRLESADSRKKIVDSSWDGVITKIKKKCRNRRVLVFSARGVTYRSRHLMTDVRMLLPHSRTDTKLDRKSKVSMINESAVMSYVNLLTSEFAKQICEIKNCTSCVFFEMRKKKDLYMWLSAVPFGPSAKFLLQNVHTMDELKLTGNCLLGSRPLLSFDSTFNSMPHLEVLKELFVQVYSTPHHHPKAKPFTDHILHFGTVDGRIWFRNYQIYDNGSSLTEIGPRIVLQLIKIFEGSFGGPTLYENPQYLTPNAYRRTMKVHAAHKYRKRRNARHSLFKRKQEVSTEDKNTIEEIFQTQKIN